MREGQHQGEGCEDLKLIVFYGSSNVMRGKPTQTDKSSYLSSLSLKSLFFFFLSTLEIHIG